VACQFWIHGFPIPGRAEPTAVRAEELGFDGLLLADSQNLVGDPFVELGVIARATTRLGLGTGIINPVTRHPALVAAAAASLQVESGGRAVLGVGRGDSSLARIGITPPTTSMLQTFLERVRTYLRGDEVRLEGGPSRIAWIAEAAITPPPVEVAATGPRTIAVAAVHGDRVMLTLGAEPERLAAGIATARAARVEAGLDPATLQIGAYLNIGCHADLRVARNLVRGSTAIFAHFSSMSARAGDGLSHADAAVVSQIGSGYDAARHGLSTASHIGALDDPFIDRFAVVGSPEACIVRLRQLIELGLDRVVVVPGSRDTEPTLLARTNEALAGDVLPALR
jgi:5,10-methylenetetrahydromethanopterin reductase